MLSLPKETADMTSRRTLWLSSIVLYALFVSWYTDFGGPLTEAEIQAYISKTENLDLGGDPSARGGFREAAQSWGGWHGTDLLKQTRRLTSLVRMYQSWKRWMC